MFTTTNDPDYPVVDWGWVREWGDDHRDEYVEEAKAVATLKDAIAWLPNSKTDEQSVYSIAKWWERLEFDADLLTKEELYDRAVEFLLKYPNDNAKHLIGFYTNSTDFLGGIEDRLTDDGEEAFWDWYWNDRRYEDY